MEQRSEHTSDVVICSSGRAAALDAAYRFAALNAAAARASRPFTVALAGGKTPAALYKVLTAAPFVDGIDWHRTHLFFGDERCVPRDSPLSNYHLANGLLIEPLSLPKSSIHAIPTELSSAEDAAAAYASDLSSYFGAGVLPRFDLILLGMGSDGHCASLFPGMPALREEARWAVASEPGLQPFVPRVTLTFPVLNNAANVMFLVAGPDKSDTVRRVIEGPSVPDELPSQSVRPTEGTLTWLLDRDAAAGLKR
jgi:6-phosphogluconolactonase